MSEKCYPSDLISTSLIMSVAEHLCYRARAHCLTNIEANKYYGTSFLEKALFASWQARKKEARLKSVFLDPGLGAGF